MSEMETGFDRGWGVWRMRLLRFVQRRVGSAQDAEDLTQEAFARLMAAEARPEVGVLRTSPERRRAYLFQIAINLIRDAARMRLVRPQMAEPDVLETIEDQPAGYNHQPDCILEHRQRIALLQQALDELPLRQRQAFVLHRFDGLTQDDVAAQMGISRRMVVKHLSRAFAHCDARLNGTDGGRPDCPGRASDA